MVAIVTNFYQCPNNPKGLDIFIMWASIFLPLDIMSLTCKNGLLQIIRIKFFILDYWKIEGHNTQKF